MAAASPNDEHAATGAGRRVASRYDLPMATNRTLLGFLLLALTAAAAAQPASEVVAGVHLIRGAFTPGSQPDGNSIVLEAPDGLVVVDTGRHVTHTQAILDFAKSVNRPIAAVINTHWHLDHIGGNALLRGAYPGVRTYASNALTAARSGFLADYRKQLEEMLAQPATGAAQRQAFEAELRLIDSGAKLAPDVVITISGPRTISGRPLRLGLETHAVTAGDLWILDEATGVLIAGDLVTLPAPFLDTACPQRWRDALARIDKLDFHLLIPGHGPPMTHNQFATYRLAFNALLTCTAKADCIDAWLRAVRPLITTAGYDEPFARAVVGYYVDVLQGDPAKIAKLCAE